MLQKSAVSATAAGIEANQGKADPEAKTTMPDHAQTCGPGPARLAVNVDKITTANTSSPSLKIRAGHVSHTKSSPPSIAAYAWYCAWSIQRKLARGWRFSSGSFARSNELRTHMQSPKKEICKQSGVQGGEGAGAAGCGWVGG